MNRFLTVFLFTLAALQTEDGLCGDIPSRQDSLRGSITPERAWWDLQYYDLNITPDIRDSTLKGENTMVYRVLKEGGRMQIDLQVPMRLEKVMQDGKDIRFLREGNVYFLEVKKGKKGETHSVTLHFSGKPKVSTNPPWSGGLTWTRDISGNPFIATTCQGDGASMWWPCKDHNYDEPDSMQIRISVKKGLMAISNGKLRSQTSTGAFDQFTWFVANPINNYAVTMNIGNYVHFSETFPGQKGLLQCDYYVLPASLEKAKVQFAQVKMLLEAFETRFGPYPFYEDGYKLVEVPYLGMEHQSAISYGNGYTNGYRNTDLSGTGWGLKFDFILVHESGHEWFGNSITARDIADMWIHEGFTCYSESVYLEHHYGKEAAALYVQGLRSRITSEEPIIGPYDVNHSGTVDMYYKGANMLHTLRQVVNNDELWFAMLLAVNREFYHQTITTAQIEAFMAKKLELELTPFFNQYLRDTRIPIFEYSIKDNVLRYRWGQCVDRFAMPLDIMVGAETIRLLPENGWKEMVLTGNEITVDPDFYVGVIRMP